MINKEHNEEQLNEVRQVIDEVIDIFRKHEMTTYEMNGVIQRIKERIEDISQLPSKENEPEHDYKLRKLYNYNYFTPDSQR